MKCRFLGAFMRQSGKCGRPDSGYSSHLALEPDS